MICKIASQNSKKNKEPLQYLINLTHFVLADNFNELNQLNYTLILLINQASLIRDWMTIN